MALFVPHNYQREATNHLGKHPHCALLADPGTGKTAIILALVRWLRHRWPAQRILIVSTLRVIREVWPGEIAKWDQFHLVSYRILHGKKKLERSKEAADIHLLNAEGLPWAAKNKILGDYQTLVIDESSIMKNWMSKRMKILKQWLPKYSRRHIMTGSPMPQSLHDYFAQQYIVDRGASLGQYVTHFRSAYFYDATSWAPYPTWRPRAGALESVLKKIDPYAFRLDGEQLLELPELIENDLEIRLPRSVLAQYTQRLEMADSAGSAFMESRQLASGYLAKGGMFHPHKMDRLAQLVEELSGSPLVVYFAFRAEGEAIADRFGCPLVYGGTEPEDMRRILALWNSGELPVVALSPAVCGHGLNLQDGGHHVAWFSLTPNQDHYFQANRRLRRQGQRAHRVFVHRLICPGTVDPTLVDILNGKAEAQARFLAGIGFGPKEQKRGEYNEKPNDSRSLFDDIWM